MLIKDPEMLGYDEGELAYGKRYADHAYMYTENGFEFDSLPLLETMNWVINEVEGIISDLEIGRDDKIDKLKSIAKRIHETERGSWLRFRGTEEDLEIALNELNEHLDERNWYTREFEGNAIEIKCWCYEKPEWTFDQRYNTDGFLFELELDLENFGGNTVYKRTIQIWENEFGDLRYELDYPYCF